MMGLLGTMKAEAVVLMPRTSQVLALIRLLELDVLYLPPVDEVDDVTADPRVLPCLAMALDKAEHLRGCLKCRRTNGRAD